MSQAETLLEVKDLSTHFFTEDGVIPSVNGISFKVKKGETIGIVGESGCGKSVTSLSLLQLVSKPGRIVGGQILFNGADLSTYTNKQMREIRGNKISMIFQEPLTSLNPVFTIGSQISEPIRLHQKLDKARAKEQAIIMLSKVGISNARKIYNAFPHQLSGGMRQRVMIAMALSCKPQLLIADEPTTALDVTIQAQILNLMKELSQESNTSIIMITHDLGVVAEMADRVIVMYAGQIVEQNNVFELFKNPKHPYTQGLLNSTPKIHQLKDELESIEGNVPTPSNMPIGCKFHPRCPFANEKCRKHEPPLIQADQGSKVRCWLHDEKEVIGL
ncbi:peptide/nickel transport system ATP-binding protein/oligopeptide transport system ATP-binding protein [Cytobacillus oceanisediminis]|jgi:oligopeptide/dipeptide ABC transporter ATP-binding protein|uniref:Peptide/nickel transport system ATP-binding protein/oligopeptide transport system ATP-binding protein n=1 Tax=Cytobacillus oceanisediminis TaxID=665099 RepID=A0A2V3AE85_9BACI|nr:ABC transporter ATP-binding protein [Cytobacillus oceanisediminis]PWW32145.1 peptide/nickel transport system ATP-binding protein/oligopeptide transport system ATP-binding protein [Cytobacillus oceanisediminis]